MTYDFAVIGAGIAGASVAYELSKFGSVLVIEQESQAGYHATGRSAAMFVPAYGPAPIRALTRASASFFAGPDDGFCDGPLLSPRDILLIAREDQAGSVDVFFDEMIDAHGLSRLDHDSIVARQPLVRADYVAQAVLDSSGSDIDVNALHQGYLRGMKKTGGQIVTDAMVIACARRNGHWQIETRQGRFQAGIIVNAAGAWAEEIGALAGAEPISLVPKRRSALMVDLPDGLDAHELPMTIDIDEQFYIKPDAGQLMLSPANEDPMAPCDAQPDEMDIAICVDRIERAFDITVRRINTKWAGLRSFVSDKAPVVGFSRQIEGFFWLAGQGGYGVQSSPATARLAAAIATESALPADIQAEGLAIGSISVDRLAEE